MSKIEFSKPNQVEQERVNRSVDASRTEKGEKVESTTNVAESEPDKISVSERAATAERLAAHVKQLPDVRQEKVEALRERIQSGSYKPSASDIANAILKDEE
jgi:negative regulator of flagellin synthesis FlgM